MKKQFIATRDFKDSGTEREFKAGPMPDDVSAGVLANYEAADLVRKRNDGDEIVEETTDAASSPKPAPRRAAAKPRAKKSTACALN